MILIPCDFLLSYYIHLPTSSQQTLNLIAKVLKNDESYREIGNQDAMTINELNFYTQILPFYKKMLINAGLNNETDWTPKFYYGFYGFEKGIFATLVITTYILAYIFN